MDTLSGSVSTFNIPSLHPISHHFKTHPSHLIPSTTVPNTSKLSNKATTFTTTHSNFLPPLVYSPQSALPLKQSSQHPEFHQKASTGYAVSLLDAARCNNVLEAVERDVKRLSKWLCNDQLSVVLPNPCVEKKEKGEILKEIVKKCKFHKYLVKLVKLLVEKTKVEMLSEVLLEFGRIYDELSGSANTQVVLVSSGVRMEENQLLGIAQRVQKLTGAAKVKVSQLVRETQLPSISFAA